MTESGLAGDGLFGIEGPGWILSDIDARLSNARQRADLLRVANICESEPSLLGMSPHLLVVGRKP